MRIIFCNIAYMKNYCGIENDTPVNGGKYIAENKDGGEAYNFLTMTECAMDISCTMAIFSISKELRIPL